MSMEQNKAVVRKKFERRGLTYCSLASGKIVEDDLGETPDLTGGARRPDALACTMRRGTA